jgi:DNA repair exonuclease SbcCD ATPase subunit
MIILQKLKWDNCFSYGEGNELDLSRDTLTQLVGTNGVGKSSIPLILEEVLFNKNSKNVKKADIANRYVNSGYNISLSFTVDDSDYVISVNRKATLKCKLTKDGEDISSHTASNTYKTLGDILGIDFKTFSQLVYQNTNASLQFLTATDTNRKKFLIDLLKLDDYVAYFDTFKEAVRIASSEVTMETAKIATIEKWLTDNILEDSSILDKMILPKMSEKDEESLRSLQYEFENISEKNKKINLNENLKEQLKSIDLDKAKMQLTSYPEEQPYIEHLGTVQTLKVESLREKEMVDKYVDLMSQTNAECPTCSQTIDDEFVASQLQKHETKLVKINEELQEQQQLTDTIGKENEIHKQAKRNIKQWEDLYRSIDIELPEQAINAEEIQKQIAELRAKITTVRSSLQEVIDENTRRERHNTRIGIIQEQTEQFETDLSESQSRLESAESKLAVLETLKKAFSTNGLLAYKIESLVKELEILTNEYLAEFSDGRFAINFVVENDKLNVEVSDNGNIIDILALSSGELARVNIATLVSIRKLMTSISRSQINVLFLDEVNQALDEVGKEKVVEVLLKEENLNTYMVSHGWTHPLLEKIEITKEDNISYLE